MRVQGVQRVRQFLTYPPCACGGDRETLHPLHPLHPRVSGEAAGILGRPAIFDAARPCPRIDARSNLCNRPVTAGDKSAGHTRRRATGNHASGRTLRLDPLGRAEVRNAVAAAEFAGARRC